MYRSPLLDMLDKAACSHVARRIREVNKTTIGARQIASVLFHGRRIEIIYVALYTA